MEEEHRRCDLHGPYTPDEAAALVMGTWTPLRTGYLCARCQEAVSADAKLMADRIDAHAFAVYMQRVSRP